MRILPFFMGLSVLAVVLPLAGCNTMFQKTYQKINVHTPGVENVYCHLHTDYIKYDLVAPGVIEVSRSRDPLTITCHKTGYLDATEILESKIYMAPSEMNVFNGLIPGTAYDFASNSVWDYPDTVTMNMVPDPSSLVPLPPVEVDVLQKKPVKPKKPKPLSKADKAETEKIFDKSLKK